MLQLVHRIRVFLFLFFLINPPSFRWQGRRSSPVQGERCSVSPRCMGEGRASQPWSHLGNRERGSDVAQPIMDYTLSLSLLSSDSVYLSFSFCPFFTKTLLSKTKHHSYFCLHSLHRPPRFWVSSISSYSLGCARGDADPHADHEVRTQ